MKHKIAAIVAGVVLTAGSVFAGQGAESTIRLTGTGSWGWTNTTWRQWVGSMMCSYPTSQPSAVINFYLIDPVGTTNLLASGSSSNMQSMVYVSERGPLVLDVGSKILVTSSAADVAVVTLENLTGE